MKKKWKVSYFIKFCVGCVIGTIFMTTYFNPEWVKVSNDFLKACAGAGMLYIVAIIFEEFENS